MGRTCSSRDVPVATADNLGRELAAHASGGGRVGEEDRAERDALAPAATNSSASRPVRTPPMPTIGSVDRFAQA